MGTSESTLQQILIQQLGFFYPELLPIQSMSGIHLHGTAKQKAQVLNTMRKEGFRKGFPDISLMLPEGKVLHLELKRPNGGVQSKEQKEIEQILILLNHQYYIVRSVDEVFKLIADNTSEMYRIKQFKEQTKKLTEDTLTEPYLMYKIGTKTNVVTAMLLNKYCL